MFQREHNLLLNHTAVMEILVTMVIEFIMFK
jgi:hypothetical protein